MMQPVTLLLVRHAHAASGGALCGHLDVPLSVAGRGQLAAIRAGFRGFPATAVYSSDLTRCRATARCAAGSVRLLPALRERHFGVWEGVVPASLPPADLWQLWNRAGFAPSGGESLAALTRRQLRALSVIRRRHAGAAVVVVGHGGGIRAVLGHWLGARPAALLRLDADPGHATLIQCFADGGVRIAASNLPPAAWGAAWAAL